MHARARFRRTLLAAGTLAVLLTTAGVAQAYPPVVQSNTRQMFAQFLFGPSIGIDPGGTQFKLSQEFGWHFAPTGEGPAIGASLSEAFGSGLFRLQLGPKFWWDIQPAAGLGLYLAPTAQLGYGLFSASGGGTAHSFNFSFGFEAKLVLGNRGMVIFQPFKIDMFAGDGFAAVYDLMFGGGVVF